VNDQPDAIPYDDTTRPSLGEVNRVRVGLARHLSTEADRGKLSRSSEGTRSPIANMEEVEPR
jgi:hypothetical protein